MQNANGTAIRRNMSAFASRAGMEMELIVGKRRCRALKRTFAMSTLFAPGIPNCVTQRVSVIKATKVTAELVTWHLSVVQTMSVDINRTARMESAYVTQDLNVISMICKFQ